MRPADGQEGDLLPALRRKAAARAQERQWTGLTGFSGLTGLNPEHDLFLFVLVFDLIL
jgi:hypothetical protein